MVLPRTETDARIVLNPFTRNPSRMKRNTRGSRWMPTKTEHSGDSNKGTRKNVSFQTHRNSDYNDLDKSLDGTTGDTSSEQLPVLQAAIYNAKDLEDLSDVPHVQLPSPRSWSSLRGGLDDDDVSPRTTSRPGRKDVRSAVSPVNDSPVIWRNSPMSLIEPIDFAATAEERKGSDGNIFSSFSPQIRKRTDTNKDAHGEPELARFYKTAKAIYNVGPKGEGQKLWSTYKQIQKDQKQHTEVEQRVPDPVTAPRRPSAPRLSAHPPTRPAPPDTDIPIRQAVPLTETLYSRNNSEVSRTSCEVPFRIGPEIKQIVDRSRSLPPVPQLQAAPKARQQGRGEINTSKPLPSNPRSKTVREAVPSTKSDANRPLPPIPLAPSTRQHKPQQPKKSLEQPPNTHFASLSTTQQTTHQSIESKPTKLRNLATHWWKALADLTSEDPPPSTKPTISRPRPITALEAGRTANLAPECGGVGGLGAVQPKRSDNAKDKQKATTTTTNTPRGDDKSAGLLTPLVGLHFPKHWCEKLGTPGDGRKRGDSDASFGCVGVERGHRAYGGGSVGEAGPSRMRDWGLRPSPLFLGGRGVKGGGERDERRDTRFYGPYEEVLDEYMA